MQECRQSGASVAGVALTHGINASIAHRWLREPTASALVPQSQPFVPVTLGEAAPSPALESALDIRVEVHRAYRELSSDGSAPPTSDEPYAWRCALSATSAGHDL